MTGLLGFHVGGRSLNQGPEQDRLDGLGNCQVDVVALQPAEAATPHVELLHYRTPRGRTLSPRSRPMTWPQPAKFTRSTISMRWSGGSRRQGVTFVSPGVVTLKDGGKAAAIRDPDGHMIVLMG